jgi:Tol biopolymer transport system component
MKFRYSVALFLAAVFIISGCFPSTVSVAPDGKIALPRGDGIYLMDMASGKSSRLYEAEKGKEPSWVQWSPRGNELLYVVKNEIFITSPDGAQCRSLYKSNSTMGFCQWSPDMALISVTELDAFRIQTEESPDKDKAPDKGEPSLKEEQLPRLTVLDAKTGAVKWQVPNIFFIHRWMPDSSSIVVFHILKKDKDTGAYTGEIARLRLSDGKLYPLAFTTGHESWLDVARNGEAIFFTAQSASLSKDELKMAEKDSKSTLFRLSLKGDKAALKEMGTATVFFGSPDSKKLLLARQNDEGGTDLVVCDSHGDNEKLVAREASVASTEMSGGKILPLWLNNDEIMFWRYVTVLAPDGKALIAYTAKADGSKTTMVQNVIDQAVLKAEKPKK